MCRKIVLLTFIFAFVAFVTAAKAGEKASNPIPMDGAGCVDPDVVLSWSPGVAALAHDVYFGVNFDDVNNATVMSPQYKGRQASTTYNPGGLSLGTTYYWRIDEVNGPTIWKGTVWSFTTSLEDCNCISAPPDMVAWWPLDEDSTPGGVSHDIVNYNHGIWYGSPTPVTGKVAGALDFNGVTDYVEVPDAPEIDFGTRDFSIDAWVKTSVGSGTHVIIDKRSGPMSTHTGYVFFLLNGNLALQLGNGGANLNYFSSLFVANGNWVHVAVTVDRDVNDGLKFYVGGVSQTRNPTGAQGTLDNNGNLLIGSDRYFSSHRFDGSIDEVELFNRALDANEILAIYQADSAGKCKDCNHNGIPDWLDILNGTSKDCQPDGIPDECQECEQAGSICKCGSVQGIPKNGSDSDWIWSRTLSTKRFRARKVGDISGPSEWSFTWEATPDVASYPPGKTYAGIYPTSGFWKQHRCKVRGDCVKKPKKYCCDDSCTETNEYGSCRWSNERCILFEDKAIRGDFCNKVELRMQFFDVDRPWWPIIKAFTNKVLDTVGCFLNWNDPKTKACKELLKDLQKLEAALNDWTGFKFQIGAYNNFLSSPPAEGTYVGPPQDGTCTHKDFQLYPNSLGLLGIDWPAKIETEWRLIRLGQGNERGDNYCAQTDEENGTCNIRYFAYGQISGTELKFMTRLSEDLSDPTLYNGVRKFNFCVDVDNDPTTGCPEWPICCDCRIQIMIESDGEKFIGDPELSIWCWGCHPTICDPLVWVLQDGIPYDFYLDEHVLEITVKLADIKNPQAAMSAWVVHERPAVGICTLPSPLDCSEPGLEIAITGDNVCPWVTKVDSFDVLDGHLDMPIYVTFTEPMAPIEQSDIVIIPATSVNLTLDSTGRILSIDPITEFVPGQYTFTLMGSITDTSGNNLDGNMDFACGDPYVFELCIPDANLTATNTRGIAQYGFALGEDIYISGHGFPPQASFYIYLVDYQTIEGDDTPLLDQSNDGPNLAHADGNGDLFWNIGSALRHGHFVGVANMNGDRRYQPNIDRVVPTCEFINTGPCYAPDDVVAWWPFDDQGSEAADELVEKNIAWYYGDPTPVPGKVAYALDFDGVSDYLVAAHNESLNFDINDFSIDAWVKTNAATGRKMIVDKRTSDPCGYSVYLYNGNLGCRLADATGSTDYDSSRFVADGKWKHIAVTVDRDNPNGLKLYVNCVSETFDPRVRSGSLDNDANLVIAGDCLSSGNRFDGTIDELNLFDVALTAADVQFIYDANSTGKCEEPIPGDVQVDWQIGWRDLEIMAEEWLKTDYFSDGNDSVYHPLVSPANLYDQEPQGSKSINLKDYAVLAEHWRNKGYWLEVAH